MSDHWAHPDADVRELIRQSAEDAYDQGWNACFDYRHKDYCGPEDPPNPYATTIPGPAYETGPAHTQEHTA